MTTDRNNPSVMDITIQGSPSTPYLQPHQSDMSINALDSPANSLMQWQDQRGHQDNSTLENTFPHSDSINNRSNQSQDNFHSTPSRLMGADRERMKDLMANSFSRNEKISILPGFKDDSQHRTSVKPCVKLISPCTTTSFGSRDQSPNGSSSHLRSPYVNPIEPRTPQYFQDSNHNSRHSQDFSPTTSYTEVPRQRSQMFPNSQKSAYNDAGAGDNSESWPYAQQKSQQAIRDAQAAYRRELDKQVEEKKMQQQHRRKLPAQRHSQSTPSPAQPHPANTTHQSVAPSISLDAFKNTGYLPAWFDPTKNNPLYNKDNSYSNISVTQSCQAVGSPESTIKHPHQSHPPQQQLQTAFHQTTVDANQSFHSLQTGIGHPGSELGLDPRLSHFLNHAGPPHSQNSPHGKYYIVTEQMLAQIQQMNSPHSSQASQTVIGHHDTILEQQEQALRPPQYSEPAFVMPPPLQKQHTASQDDSSYCVEESEQQHEWATQPPLRPPTSFAQDPQQSRGHDEDQYQPEIEIVDHNTPGSESSRRGESFVFEDLDKTRNSLQNLPSPHVSQTADQLPTEEVVKTYYKSQLALQIEERRRSELEKQSKEMEAEAKLQKKIEEDQKRMAREYEEEQRLQKLRNEELVRRQELIVKEKERFEREAEELREKRRMERRRQSLMSASSDTTEDQKPLQTLPEYLSPADLTICAASTWSTDSRAKSPVKDSSSDEQIPVSPRPRTVILGQHEHIFAPVAEVERKPCNNLSTTIEPNTRSKSTSYINQRPSHPKSSRTPRNASANSSARVRHDVHFLANVRRALLAEDHRVERSIKERHRLFLSF